MREALVAASLAMWPTATQFRRALKEPEAAQRRVLGRITERLRECEYGRSLRVRNPDEFLRRVPVADYDALEPWLSRQRATEACVLTSERVVFYEKTSGSSGPHKLIPYTRSLRRSFSRMFAIWAHDLILRGPGLKRGRTYFSVSPSFASGGLTERGRPIGMRDDRDYLDGWLRHLASPFLVDAREAARARDAEGFKRATAMCLLAEEHLEIISVWNPSFLGVHLDYIERHRNALAEAVGLRGRRAEALLSEPVEWRRVWPSLRLVSCWRDAAAGLPARALQARLAGVCVQGKGLLATEAPVTVPLCDAPGAVPLVTEVYIELEDASGSLHPIHSAREGENYGLVLSQLGGLYRYRLGDRVRVGPRFEGTPTLSLLGRDGGVSDLVGEKLSEAFVAAALEEVAAKSGGFATLVPLREPCDRYALLLGEGNGDTEEVAHWLDERLGEAHHYRHARELGQLAPPLVRAAPGAAEAVTDFHRRRGMKLGDVKHRALEVVPADEVLARWIVQGERA